MRPDIQDDIRRVLSEKSRTFEGIVSCSEYHGHELRAEIKEMLKSDEVFVEYVEDGKKFYSLKYEL